MGAIGFTRHAIAPMGRSYALAATSTAPEVGRTGNIRTISVRQPRPALVVEVVGLQRQHPFLLPGVEREQDRPRFDRIRKEEKADPFINIAHESGHVVPRPAPRTRRPAPPI